MTAASFPRERLDRISGLHRAHFWHAPRHRLLAGLVSTAMPRGARILDVGCGSGAMVDELSQRGYRAAGVDPWATGTADGRRLDHARLQSTLQAGQAESLPFPDGAFDAVCAFDVLEHADDVEALGEFARVLVPGGRLFVSVPAHRWLWSNRDVLAGHRRRYDRASLVSTVRAAGFKVDRVFGYQFLLLPLLACARLLARRRPAMDTMHEDAPGAFANALLRACNDAEVRFGRWMKPPTGSSLVLRARLCGDGGDATGER